MCLCFQIQQLKSINNIFCDWQFASLKVVFIPIAAGSSADSPITPCDSDTVMTKQEMLNLQQMTRTTSANHITSGTAAAAAASTAPDKKKTYDIDSYFNRYDSSLAEIKDSVEKLSQSIR